MELRRRVVAAVDRGLAKGEIAGAFGVSVPTINRYLRLRRETGSLEPRRIPGRPPVKGAALAAGLGPQLRGNADATVPEHRALWEATTGERVSEATVARAIKRLGRTRKESR